MNDNDKPYYVYAIHVGTQKIQSYLSYDHPPSNNRYVCYDAGQIMSESKISMAHAQDGAIEKCQDLRTKLTNSLVAMLADKAGENKHEG